jgi:hypothetical protein
MKETENKISIGASMEVSTMLLRLPESYKCHNQQWQGRTHDDTNFGPLYLKKTKSACSYETATEIANWGVGVNRVGALEHRYYVSWMIPLAGGEGLKMKKTVQPPIMTDADFEDMLDEATDDMGGMHVS